MEIRKADSKGRVTGFEPGKIYTVSRVVGGTAVILNPIEPAPFPGGSVSLDNF